MAEEPIPNCKIPFLVPTDFFAQKPIVLAKMLIQGPLGLDLQIYKKTKPSYVYGGCKILFY